MFYIKFFINHCILVIIGRFNKNLIIQFIVTISLHKTFFEASSQMDILYEYTFCTICTNAK